MTTQISGTTGVNKVQDLVVTPEKLSQKLTLMTAVDLTSLGDKTKCDFTGIPSWAKRISLNFAGLSTNGASIPMVQIGSGSIELTGYAGTGGLLQNSASTFTSAHSTGFLFGYTGAWAATTVIGGTLTLGLLNPATNTWVISGLLGLTNAAVLHMTSGTKSLAGILDRLRITTVDGTAANNFDAGTINVLYEG